MAEGAVRLNPRLHVLSHRDFVAAGEAEQVGVVAHGLSAIYLAMGYPFLSLTSSSGMISLPLIQNHADFPSRFFHTRMGGNLTQSTI